MKRANFKVLWVRFERSMPRVRPRSSRSSSQESDVKPLTPHAAKEGPGGQSYGCARLNGALTQWNVATIPNSVVCASDYLALLPLLHFPLDYKCFLPTSRSAVVVGISWLGCRSATLITFFRSHLSCL